MRAAMTENGRRRRKKKSGASRGVEEGLQGVVKAQEWIAMHREVTPSRHTSGGSSVSSPCPYILYIYCTMYCIYCTMYCIYTVPYIYIVPYTVHILYHILYIYCTIYCPYIAGMSGKRGMTCVGPLL